MRKLVFTVVFSFFIFVTPSTASAQNCIPGDANCDGNVDGLDFTVWLTNYNQNVFGGANGDFNNNNIVDGVDFTIWLSNYGRVPTPTPQSTNTPTPTRTGTKEKKLSKAFSPLFYTS